MAQGGLVVMAGMVALVITQSDKGGIRVRLGIDMLASCGYREWLAWAWLVALASLVHITINTHNTRLAKTR